MRRARTTSRDASQDPPVTDIERDIIWGDSPPPRRICLSTTPGRRVTRASAAEQDLTDLIECIHPKQENKESSTPPLLGLWMRNRQEPNSGKKKQRPARLARRTTGRKLSRIGLDKAVLDDLRILKEWTGNLAAAVEEPSNSGAEKHDGETKTEEVHSHSGGGDCEAMDCDDLEDLFADESLKEDVESSRTETQPAAAERRRSTNRSYSDDLWDSEDWYDDDSIIRIATQVENEALTQQQKKGSVNSAKSETAKLSPTQTGSMVNAKSKNCQNGYYQSKMDVGNSVNVQRNTTALAKQAIDSGSKANTQSHCKNNSKLMTSGSRAAATCTWTNQLASAKASSKASQSWKPAATSNIKTSTYISRSNNSSMNSKAACTASKPSTSTHYSTAYVSNARTTTVKNSNYTNANMNSSNRSVSKIHGKSSSAATSKVINNSAHKVNKVVQMPSRSHVGSSVNQAGSISTPNAMMSGQTVRVPPMTSTIGATSGKGQLCNDSLEDLFAGDHSLPDDMLLALLDNDSDFEEYTCKAPATVPVPSSNTQKQSAGQAKGSFVPSQRNMMNLGKSTVSTAPTHSMSTRAQLSTGAAMGSKGHGTYVANKCTTKSSAPKNQQIMTSEAAGTTHSRLTRSTAQSPNLPPPVPKQSTNPQGGSSRMDGGVKSGEYRKSLSQPIPPTGKQGGVPLQRCCSQQEIEQKRQAALAKRRKNKNQVSPTS